MTTKSFEAPMTFRNFEVSSVSQFSIPQEVTRFVKSIFQHMCVSHLDIPSLAQKLCIIVQKMCSFYLTLLSGINLSKSPSGSTSTSSIQNPGGIQSITIAPKLPTPKSLCRFIPCQQCNKRRNQNHEHKQVMLNQISGCSMSHSILSRKRDLWHRRRTIFRKPSP